MKWLNVFLPAFFLVLLSSPSRGQSPEQVLSKIDSVQNAYSDLSATQQLQLIDENGRIRERTVEIRQKGKELRMVRFLEPDDVRGVGFLRLASDRLYLYLPAFRKVRRIASSAADENFMGTDFTYEDLSQSTYSDDYTAIDLSTQNGQYRVTLEPKSDADVSYAQLIVYADPTTWVLRKVEYYRERGQFKVLEINDVERMDGYWMGRTMRMKTLDNNHETIMKLSDIRFDRGIPDSEFSERTLKRPIR